jgi:hypothetical protein
VNRPIMLSCFSLLAAVTLLAGCSSKHSSADGGSQSSIVIDTTPATETATTESPAQGGDDGISVPVASLPIGGNGGNGGTVQCSNVNLIGAPNPLPSDVSIAVTGLSLRPDGIFEFGGDPGACDLPSESVCASSWTWTADSPGGCLVTVTQTVDSEETVTLEVAGTVHCEIQNSCDAITNAGGSQITFTAQLGVVTSPDTSSSTPDTSSSTPDTGSPTPDGGESS